MRLCIPADELPPEHKDARVCDELGGSEVCGPIETHDLACEKRGHGQGTDFGRLAVPTATIEFAVRTEGFSQVSRQLPRAGILVLFSCRLVAHPGAPRYDLERACPLYASS